MKKRLASMFLALFMLLTLVALPARANYEPPTMVYVAGVNVFDGGYWLNDGQGGITAEGASASNFNVAFEPSTYTLALNDAQISKYSWNVAGMNACIWANGTLNILLMGSSSVNQVLGSSDTTYRCAGISVYAASSRVYPFLTFQGSGSLTVQAGSTNNHSDGIYCVGGINMNATGTVTALGGACSANSGSCGVHLDGTDDDLESCLDLASGSFTAGTLYGGPKSYAVYGKIGFPTYDTYTGSFTAYCSADAVSALAAAPLYMPKGAVLAGSASTGGAGLEAYNAEHNNTYLYVTTRSARAGAAVSGNPTLKSRTGYTLEVNPVTVSGSNPGGQVVEYAVGASYSADVPVSGWQTSTVFVGLAPSRQYKVWARSAATLDYAAGTARSSEIVGTKDDGFSSGVSVGGIEVDTKSASTTFSVGGGTATYVPSTHTLTLSGTIRITEGMTEPHGRLVGIFSTGDMNIVLADGADVSIELHNTEKDFHLVTNLAASKAIISSNATGILSAGSLTISAAEGCETVPKLSVRVTGGKSVYGLYSDEGSVSVAADNGVDVDVYAAATGKEASAYGVYGAQGISVACRTANVTVSGATTNYWGAAMCTGEIPTLWPVNIQAGTVTVQNLTRVSGFTTVKGKVVMADGFIAQDAAGNILTDEDDIVFGHHKYVTFIPTGNVPITGSVTVSGTFRVGYAVSAAVSADANILGAPIYAWYRISESGEETLIRSGGGETYASYKLVPADQGYRIQCRVSSAGRKGEIMSTVSEAVLESLFPSLYVNNKPITAENYTDVLGDGGSVSYDCTTATLFLNNVTIDGSSLKNKVSLIYDNKDTDLVLTIHLTGTNTLSALANCSAIKNAGSLRFTGSGSLTASTVSFENGYTEGVITAGGSVTFEDSCTVTATCQRGRILSVGGDLTCSGSSSLTADNVCNGNYTTIAVTSGTTTVEDSASIVIRGNRAYGLDTEALVVTGGTVDAENSAKGFGTPTAALSATVFTIRGGSVSAHATEGYAISSGSTFIVAGGTVIARNDVTNYQPIRLDYGAAPTFEGPYQMFISTDKDGAARSPVTGSPSTYFSSLSTSKANCYIAILTEFEPTVTAKISKGKVTATIRSDGRSMTALAFIVRYSSEGRFLGSYCKAVTFSRENASDTVSYTFADAATGDTYKVFLFDAGSYRPLCDAASL